MQRPTDNLRADHELTTRATRVLSRIAADVRAGAPFPADDCATLLRFQREFVLAVHMRQEDDLLGPALAMRGDDRAAALVGELLRLHEEIRELSHSLVLFWEPVGELTAEERAGFADTVDALVSRQEKRHRLEETELFPAYDATIPADDQLGWMDEARAIAAGRSAAQWRGDIRSLADKYGV